MAQSQGEDSPSISNLTLDDFRFPDGGATLVPTLWPEDDIAETKSRRNDFKNADAQAKGFKDKFGIIHISSNKPNLAAQLDLAHYGYINTLPTSPARDGWLCLCSWDCSGSSRSKSKVSEGRLAPVTDECSGCISRELVHRALGEEKGG